MFVTECVCYSRIQDVCYLDHAKINVFSFSFCVHFRDKRTVSTVLSVGCYVTDSCQ